MDNFDLERECKRYGLNRQYVLAIANNKQCSYARALYIARERKKREYLAQHTSVIKESDFN